jgi:thiol-disulfide isomerase/thioredoxin
MRACNTRVALAEAFVWTCLFCTGFLLVARAESPSSSTPRDAGKSAAEQPNNGPESSWPEGSKVNGRVVDYQGNSVANAEVLLLGKEHIIVEADRGDPNRKTWFVFGSEKTTPPSTRTNSKGEFTITRDHGSADRLAVISTDPLFWEVSRNHLTQDNEVEIKLPQSGSLVIHCELPGKPAKQPVMIEWRRFEDKDWTIDSDELRFHFSSYSLANPGPTVFEHLPPGQCEVQRQIETPQGKNGVLMSDADRQVVKIESRKQAAVAFDRTVGHPLTGHIRGLENVELSFAHVDITYSGPRELAPDLAGAGKDQTAFDIIPITSEGGFTTDAIPPGTYWVDLDAVRADTTEDAARTTDYKAHKQLVVPESGKMPELEIVAKRVPKDGAPTSNLPAVSVFDEGGQRLSRFQIMIHCPSGGGSGWKTAAGGRSLLGLALRNTTVADVIVRAEGYASALKRFGGDDFQKLSRGEGSVTVPRGDKVELRFRLPEEMTWPAGKAPEVYFDLCKDDVRSMRQPENRAIYEKSANLSALDENMLNIQAVGSGVFSFRAGADTPPFYVAVHLPGFLQSFESGPYTAKDIKDGVLEVALPRPASLEVAFDPGKDDAASRPFKSAYINLLIQIPGKSSYISLATQDNAADGKTLALRDLPPGNYWVRLVSEPKGDANKPYSEEPDAGRFSDTRQFSLKAGQVEKIDFHYVPLDSQAFRGKRSATIRIETADGKPAVGRELRIDYYDGHYGSLRVYSGTVPESGKIMLDDITDVVPAGIGTHDPYLVRIDKQQVATFRFHNSEGTERFAFHCPPQAGDMAPDVELLNVANGQTVKLSSLRGKLVLVDFWATWCGPCQPAMEALNKLATEHADWEERLVLLPVSIDDEAEQARQHLASRGWTHIQTYWTGVEGKVSFQAPAMQAFVVNGVPTSFLIDGNGKILWRGHPMADEAGQTLESRIAAALK